jgi:hypothetical protein
MVEIKVSLYREIILTEQYNPGSYNLVHLNTVMRGRCLLFLKIQGQGHNITWCGTEQIVMLPDPAT